MKRKHLPKPYPHPPTRQVLTVDACQGSEADVVILSMVRSEGVNGFLEDRRRMCVALSRAKRECIIVGSADNFERHGSAMWQAIVAHFHRGAGGTSAAELAAGLGSLTL